MSEKDPVNMTDVELKGAILRIEHRLEELWLRQKSPRDFPTHDVHGTDKYEIEQKEAQLVTLRAELARRQR